MKKTFNFLGFKKDLSTPPVPFLWILTLSIFGLKHLCGCGHIKDEQKIKPDTGIFIVQEITGVEEDSSKVLAKYKLVSDTMAFENYISNEQQGYNPFKFFLTDTSGKYKIGDTLILTLKTENTYE